MATIRNCLLFLVLLAGCGGPTGDGHSDRSAHAGASPPPVPVKVAPFALGRPDLVLLVTGRTSGTLELCNCRGPMAGGLSRRSGLAVSYRRAFDHCLLVDAGDFFWIEPENVRNDYILKGYAQIGYDAVTLGDQEWAAPPARLRQLLASEKLPYLSTGVQLCDGGAPLPTAPEVTRQWGGLKVAILSQVGQSSLIFLGEDRVKALKCSPEDLSRRAGELKRQGFLVVVIAHADGEEAGQIARGGLADLVIRGHSTRSEERLVNSQGDSWTPADSGAPVAKVGGSDVVGVIAMKVAGGKIAAIEYRMEPLTDRWPADQRLLQTYQAYAHAAMRAALDAKRTAGLDYAPSTECGRCHQAQYRNWTHMRHSHAYKTLTDAKRQGDPNCLMCHTSGFGTEKGFYTIASTPNLANVNCQDCHRFNIKEHHQAGFKPPRPNEELCTSCHTAVTDPDFKFAVKKPRIACPLR